MSERNDGGPIHFAELCQENFDLRATILAIREALEAARPFVANAVVDGFPASRTPIVAAPPQRFGDGRDGGAMMDEARARRVVEWYDGEDSAFHADLVWAIIEAFKSVRAEATLAERERIRAECAKQALLGAAQWDRVFPENPNES